jgi:Uma2 family endonuclease
MSVDIQRRRFTVDEYYAMADAGILTEDDRVELINGEIIQMAAIGSHHAGCAKRLNRLLVQQAGEAAIVQVNDPVRLSDLSEPQPDFAVLRTRDDFYSTAHPHPEDTLLVIEVAQSSLGYDREVKLPFYALAGIPEVWIVDVEMEVVEVYSEPFGSTYQIREMLGRNAVLVPPHLPFIAVPVRSILP